MATIAWAALYNAGFILPQQQIKFINKHKFVACVDMYREIKIRKIVLEPDGKIKYTVIENLMEEKHREDVFRQLGYKVIRAGWDHVMNGELVQMLIDHMIPTRRYQSMKIPQ